MPTPIDVHELDAPRTADFRQLLSQPPEGWCWCVAWDVATWDGWSERTATQNKELRESLWIRGQYDAFVIYSGSQPIGWIRVGPIARWPKLAAQRHLRADDPAYVVACMGMKPEFRRQGLMRDAMREVIRQLGSRGVPALIGVPKRLQADEQDAGEVWNGPRQLFAQLGFLPVAEHADFTEFRLQLA